MTVSTKILTCLLSALTIGATLLNSQTKVPQTLSAWNEDNDNVGELTLAAIARANFPFSDDNVAAFFVNDYSGIGYGLNVRGGYTFASGFELTLGGGYGTFGFDDSKAGRDTPGNSYSQTTSHTIVPIELGMLIGLGGEEMETFFGLAFGLSRVALNVRAQGTMTSVQNGEITSFATDEVHSGWITSGGSQLGIRLPMQHNLRFEGSLGYNLVFSKDSELTVYSGDSDTGKKKLLPGATSYLTINFGVVFSM